MIKILTIVGARPQIIKAAALSRAIRTEFTGKINELILHTGQHYDSNMSDVFFEELQIPKPDYNLNVGSGSHGKQTALMLSGIEEILLKEKPNALLVYGDTNSTLAGSLAASKIHIPVIHVEAGLRSWNKSMPEEVNRILCDNVSTLLFSPTKTGFKNLLDEGIGEETNSGSAGIDNPFIYHCGDVMYDNSLYFAAVANKNNNYLINLGLEKNKFLLATIHRDNNTDNVSRLQSIFEGLDEISKKYKYKVVIPLHPRTKKLLETEAYSSVKILMEKNEFFQIIPPASFLEMILLESNCRLVLTDSGGVQKEAFFFQKPCIILRPETEWVELLETGSALIADADTERIVGAFEDLNSKNDLKFPDLFGDGKASTFICEQIIRNL